jgi:hypothetical protein
MAECCWIPKAIKQKSSLRKQLHVPEGEPINTETLEKIKRQEKGSHISSHGKTVPVTKMLKKRATLALTLKNLQKKQRRKK